MNHPCHDSQVNRLRKIEGQVRGLQKMIEERRYCMDIVSQLRAVQGALKKVELGILETHLQHCVQVHSIPEIPKMPKKKSRKSSNSCKKIEPTL